jgi:hypothetical protein
LSLSLKDNNSTTKNFNVRKQYSEDWSSLCIKHTNQNSTMKVCKFQPKANALGQNFLVSKTITQLEWKNFKKIKFLAWKYPDFSLDKFVFVFY